MYIFYRSEFIGLIHNYYNRLFFNEWNTQIYEGESNENLKNFTSRNLLYTKWTAEHHGRYGVLIHDSYPDVRLFHSPLRGCFPSRWLQLLQWSLVSQLGVSGQAVTEVTPFMNFLLHSYTCCSDRHASPYWTFIRRWISMGFNPSLLKKRMTERCFSLVHVASEAAILHYCCAVMLYSCIVLPPVGHSSNREYHYCQLTGQLSHVSKFYRTFKVLTGLSLVCVSPVLSLKPVFCPHTVICVLWTDLRTNGDFFPLYSINWLL